jgi:hypothetical protein
MARKSKRSAEERTVVVTRSGDAAAIRAEYALQIEGWGAMGESTKDAIVSATLKFNAFPDTTAVRVSGNDTQKTVEPAGGNHTLHDLRLCETFATQSDALVNTRLRDLQGDDLERSINGGIAFVRGMNPKDPAQSTLAVQMAATHNAAIKALRRADSGQTIEQVKLFGTLATKLLNTYARQAEVLAKLQRGGEQIIKHVHIDNRGGQAVVAEQVVTGGSNDETGHQPHERVAALLGENAGGHGVPIPCAGGPEAVPIARRSFAGSA